MLIHEKQKVEIYYSLLQLKTIFNGYTSTTLFKFNKYLCIIIKNRNFIKI